MKTSTSNELEGILSKPNPCKPSANIAVPDDKSQAPSYIKVRLSQIIGLHPCLQSLYEDLDIPKLRFPSKQAKNKEFLSTLVRNPLIVIRDSRLRCIGKVRTYFAAKEVLDPETEIYCIELFNLTETQIMSDFLQEYFFDPALFGYHTTDIKRVAETARRAMALGIWNLPEQPVEVFLSNLYCTGKRGLMPKPKTVSAEVKIDLPETEEIPAVSN